MKQCKCGSFINDKYVRCDRCAKRKHNRANDEFKRYLNDNSLPDTFKINSDMFSAEYKDKTQTQVFCKQCGKPFWKNKRAHKKVICDKCLVENTKVDQLNKPFIKHKKFR